MAADVTLLCNVFLYLQYLYTLYVKMVTCFGFQCYVFQYLAIFDHMFTPDIYIGKTPSLVFVHYGVIQSQNEGWVQQSQ
jgi:hypothetical protein